MNTLRSQLTPADLPKRLSEAFRQLRNGRHICSEDGALYRDMEVDKERYRVVFSSLGHELVHHAQGFFYLKGGPSLSSKRLQAITLFVFVLFQDLEDHKVQEASRAWVQTLTNRIFDITKLPHFATTQLRGMMANLGVTQDTLRAQVLRPLAGLGMVHLRDDDHFQFRSPIYRFVDLALEYADQDWKRVQEPDRVTSRPPDDARSTGEGDGGSIARADRKEEK